MCDCKVQLMIMNSREVGLGVQKECYTYLTSPSHPFLLAHLIPID